MSLWVRLVAPWRLLWFLDDVWGHGWDGRSLAILAGGYIGLLAYWLLTPETERWRELFWRTVPSLF